MFCIQQCFGLLPVVVESLSKNNPVGVISVFDTQFGVSKKLKSSRCYFPPFCKSTLHLIAVWINSMKAFIAIIVLSSFIRTGYSLLSLQTGDKRKTGSQVLLNPKVHFATLITLGWFLFIPFCIWGGAGSQQKPHYQLCWSPCFVLVWFFPFSNQNSWATTRQTVAGSQTPELEAKIPRVLQKQQSILLRGVTVIIWGPGLCLLAAPRTDLCLHWVLCKTGQVSCPQRTWNVCCFLFYTAPKGRERN